MVRVPLDGSEASKGELGAAAQRSKTPCAASDIRTFLIADHNSNEGIFIMFLIFHGISLIIHDISLIIHDFHDIL